MGASLFSAPYLLAGDDKPLNFDTIETQVQLNGARSKENLLKNELVGLLERRNILLKDRQKHYNELSGPNFAPCSQEELAAVQALQGKLEKDLIDIKRMYQACAQARKHEKDTVKMFQDSPFKEEDLMDKKIEELFAQLAKLSKAIKQAETKLAPVPVAQPTNTPEQAQQ